MPRKADAGLEGRIVDVAYRLWSDKGEKALTMRAVAKAARTTTPTLYERFHDKHDLMEFLRERARRRLFAAIQPAKSAGEICRLALNFISRHGHEYRLLTSEWATRFAQQKSMPSYQFLRERLAEQLGGKPDDHGRLALELIALVHGTAMLRPESDEHRDIAAEFQTACLEACDALIEVAAARSARDGKRAVSRHSCYEGQQT
jgi:AcrR family transcriptional regulator